MKEIKAYLHRQQVASVIQALKDRNCWGEGEANACRNVAVYQVQGSLIPTDAHEEHYSMALAEVVTYEYKIELVCEDPETDALVDIVREAAARAGPRRGWIFVVNVEQGIAVSS